MLAGLVRTTTFQLTRPVWGEPCKNQYWSRLRWISTHSPRVGRTRLFFGRRAVLPHFNSLAPCGANPVDHRSRGRENQFQLTRPVWGEPPFETGAPAIYAFQLTRPVWGEPCRCRRRSCTVSHFNSLAPCGANHRVRFFRAQPWVISTHSPRVGRTPRKDESVSNITNFNSLAPCGANRRRRQTRTTASRISTHSPRVGRTSL